MQKKQLFRRHAAVLTAAALTVVSLPVVAASSAEYNTWTGYVLRNAAGQYLSVSGGTEGEGAQVGFYDADGVAPYNITRGISRRQSWASPSNPPSLRGNTT